MLSSVDTVVLKKKIRLGSSLISDLIRLEERSIRSFFDFIHKIRTTLKAHCALM